MDSDPGVALAIACQEVAWAEGLAYVTGDAGDRLEAERVADVAMAALLTFVDDGA